MKRHWKIVSVVVAAVLLLSAMTMTVSARGPGGWFGGPKGAAAPEGWGWGPMVPLGFSEAVAEALGMGVEALQADLRDGKTIADLAEEKGVDLQDVKDAADAARKTAVRDGIEQAIKDGKLTREQADWMLDGLESGYAVRGRFGRGGFPGFGYPAAGQTGLEAAAEALGMTVDELSLQLWGGRTLVDLAERQGVVLDDVQSAIEASREAAMRAAIAQAVQDGKLTQEQADWLLRGLEGGYLGSGHGGFGGMRGGFRSFPNRAPTPASEASNL